MAVLINGNGNEAIYAQQDADWFASIMGNQTAITGIGNKFAASLLDANTIGVSDGVIITQEGRRIQLDVNEIDSFDIPAGGQGETNYYIIGYHLVTGDLSEQYCETFVRLMDNDTDTIPEDTFRGGADEVFVSLYRVTQDDLVITDMDLLLPEITNLSQLNTNLTASNDQPFKFGYDSVSGKYGYVVESGGADTFIPFKYELEETILWTGTGSEMGTWGTALNLSKSIRDFKYIKFYFTSSGGNNTAIVEVSELLTYRNDGNAKMGGLNCRNTSTQLSRAYYYRNDTSIAFGPGYCLGYSQAADVCNPIKISGLN